MNETVSTEIKHPFDPSLIRVESRVTTIDNIIKRLRHKEINLDPSFQRSSNVWKAPARSRLIESLLVRIPIPSFYFDAANENKWIVIDGLQRLTTFKQFVIDESLRLSELEYLTELNYFTFSELPRMFQRRIEETLITVVLIEKGTPENVMYNIFKRINTGGESLKPQEIRHALYQGDITILLKEISSSKEFKGIIKRDNSRMEASELILLVLSVHYFGYEKSVLFSYDDLLRNAMKQLNEKDISYLQSLKEKYMKALILASELFGKKLFSKQTSRSSRRNPFNKNIYETIMTIFMNLSDNEQRLLLVKKESFLQSYFENMRDGYFSKMFNSRKPTPYIKRFKIIEDIIMEQLK